MKLKYISVIIGLVGMLLLTACSSGEELKPFAQCLTDNGATMYGAFWCPHCKTQKAEFGDAWDNVNYIECSLPDRSGQTQVCQQAGIEGYPTWEFADGERMSGHIPLQVLAQKTGCELPA